MTFLILEHGQRENMLLKQRIQKRSRKISISSITYRVLCFISVVLGKVKLKHLCIASGSHRG